MATDRDTTGEMDLNLFWTPGYTDVDVSIYFQNLNGDRVVREGLPVTALGNPLTTTITFRRVPPNTPNSFMYYSDIFYGRTHQVIAQFSTGGIAQARATAVGDG